MKTVQWGAGIDVAAPAEVAWELLVDTTCWPRWGPTVRSARLDDGGTRIGTGASGAVQTAVGAWLPFTISDWEETATVRSWSWQVAGVPATSHRVTAVDAGHCRIQLSVPWWAPAYLPVVVVALPRLRRLAERRANG